MSINSFQKKSLTFAQNFETSKELKNINLKAQNKNEKARTCPPRRECLE